MNESFDSFDLNQKIKEVNKNKIALFMLIAPIVTLLCAIASFYSKNWITCGIYLASTFLGFNTFFERFFSMCEFEKAFKKLKLMEDILNQPLMQTIEGNTTIIKYSLPSPNLMKELHILTAKYRKK